ncbi:MAG: DUF1800 family protein [Verrucomicrobiota bacterium]
MQSRIVQLAGISTILTVPVFAAPFAQLWQLGADDHASSPFSQESWGPNNPPGSATVKDDDFYLAGTYATPIGTLATDEAIANFERAITEGDPRNRIHFPLTTQQASATSRLRVTVDLIGGGAWINGSIPGFSSHDVVVTFNGHVLGAFPAIHADRTLVFTVPASSVAAVAGPNKIEIARTGGAPGGYITLDFIRLEADATGLADADADSMPRWFEETYGLDDNDSADASLDTDGDGLNHLAEFQAGTNPTDADSDNDSLTDSQEITLGTHPLETDSDDDGIADNEETTTSPLSADTDADGFPDQFEISQGSDPANATKMPFLYPGAISLQFLCEDLASARLGPWETAGLFPLPHWNASPLMPGWMADGAILNGSRSALLDNRGVPTNAAATWSYHYADDGIHKGPGNEKLLDGMIRTQHLVDPAAVPPMDINTPVALNLTGIPYASYDLIAYVGQAYPNARGFLRLGTNDATRRYFIADSAPPFLRWQEITSTTSATAARGNFVRYRNLTASSQSLRLESLENQAVALIGIQIIDNATDSDADSMTDAVEIENQFNPAVADATADADGDTRSNISELAAGTDPHHPDSDRDGIPDGAEASRGTSPLNPDSDADGLTDGDEIQALPFPSLPTLADSDSDGYNDAAERSYGSNPMAAASTPPGVPIWNAATRTWLWRIDNLRVLWNHPQSMLGAISADETMLFEAVADINQSGWSRQIGIGLRWINGRLTHRFRGVEGVFHRAGQPNDGFWDSDWNNPPVDRSKTFGFSGHGSSDDSVPLRLEFSATQPTAGVNVWTLRFTLADLTNLASPVTLANFTNTNAVAADPTLAAGTTVWKNQQGVAGKIDIWQETGVRALISATPLGPADADSDGMPDAWESTWQFNPTNAADALLDWDNDGLPNLDEFLAASNPKLADTDNDGVPDGIEVFHGSNPLSSTSVPPWFNFTGNPDDLDADGLSDAWVLWSGGKHRTPSADDDGDGMTNAEESIAGTHPDDASSRFDLTSWRSGNDLVLSWTDLPLKAQLVESGDNLTRWQPETLSTTTVGGRRQAILTGEFSAPEDALFFRAGARPIDTDGDGIEDWIEKTVLGSSVTAGSSLAQPILRANGQALAGDAVALLEKLQGASPTGASPGNSAPGTPSPVNASRFLMQATFGPTPDSIRELRDLGYAAWIAHQISLPPSLTRPYIREIKADGAGPRTDPHYNFNELDQFVHGNNITTPFARNAIAGEDQLRQRVAFALSQILVVSRRDANLEEKAEAMACYYDCLVRNALGNYRDLLREITFHPAMGWYLSHAGNQKADPSIPRYPDENYARELMQLFTIGLWELNPDGSRKLDANGEPIPTYDNGDITELARTFTGLYFASPYGWGGGGWADEHFTMPMVMYPERHDFEMKRLPNGFIIPAREPTETNGKQDILDAVDALFEHPNTPPFVCRQLIQFLVTDNPTPGYIRRVQDVFVDDGHGTRGNMAAVIKAILMDHEARNPPLSASFGKVREPVVRTMHLGRLCHLADAHPDFVWWNWTENYYAPSSQEPMNPPSVFNFYTPVYQSPGWIRDSGLVSPGFQIINTYTAVSFPNLLWDYVHDGFKSGWSWDFPLDFSDPLRVAENPAALVDQMNLLVCAGNMTARTRSIVLTALADPALSRQDRVALALWSAMTSPEGVVQK